jgi:holo-[acyl-carrier protein] synthase
MICGIGVDMVRIDRIHRLWHKGQLEKFALKILSEREFERYHALASAQATVSTQSVLVAVRFIAKAFAVKEAAAKALGTGFRLGVKFSEFEITKDHLHKPHLELLGVAKSLSLSRSVGAIHVSVTDEKEHVVAFVIMEAL